MQSMEVIASLQKVRVSPNKARLVVDMCRGKKVSEAQALMRFMPNKTAFEVERLLKSVAANAENNYELAREDMVVSTIFADGGPMLKRFKAGARGRYKPRKKRTSHLTIVLVEREESKNGS
jgi:large subunit ribosomal protein L22